MRVIVRKEKPHPGAQLRSDDVDGMRITAFATTTGAEDRGTQLPHLELRTAAAPAPRTAPAWPRTPACATWPCKGLGQNRIWCALVALALEITAWMQTLAPHDHDARRWEPKRLRLRLFTVPATIARTGRRLRLHLSPTAPWAGAALAAMSRLQALAAPG